MAKHIKIWLKNSQNIAVKKQLDTSTNFSQNNLKRRQELKQAILFSKAMSLHQKIQKVLIFLHRIASSIIKLLLLYVGGQVDCP